MTAIDHIKAAQQAVLVDEDGERVRLELAPPLTRDDIVSLETKVGQPLPQDLRHLLSFCSGIDGCLEGIDFTGRNMAFEHAEVFPNGLPIAADGFGNFWVLDLTPQTTRVAPVFFACHDAPVTLYQSPDLASFLAEVFRMLTPPHKSLVDDVHDDRLFNVWRKNPGVIDQSVASTSQDPAIRAFALSLSPNFQLVDLRNVEPGMGFSWGRYGPRTEIRRSGFERIFAYAKPPARDGFLGRFFRRRGRATQSDQAPAEATSNDVMEHVMDAAQRCVSPVWVSTGLLQNPTGVTSNGTCVFVDTGEKKLILTAYHVFEDFRKAKAVDGSVGLAINLGPGISPFIPNPQVLDEDKALDLVVLNWPEMDEYSPHEKQYFPIAKWPIPSPRRGEAITIVGFPGALRQVSERSGSFSPIGIGMVVSNEPGRNIWLVDEHGTLRTETGGLRSSTNLDLGGISGSPGFFYRDGRFHLAGIVYECNGDGRMVALSSVASFRPDGSIA